MGTIGSPTFLEICNSLRTKRGYAFELICNDYLKARYPNLVPWVSTNVESTIAGTPDAFIFDETGALIACQYGSSPETWRTKLLGSREEAGDAEKVANLVRKHQLTVRQLIFCTTAEIDPTTVNSTQKEIEARYGFRAEICDLRRIASDIESHYPGIAARRLGIPLRLQHFMTLDEYIDSGNQRYWPKRNDIDEGKVFKPLDELKGIETRIESDKHCLLLGSSGSGKTVLAIIYGLWWRGDLKNSKKHPEAFVFYLDASSNHNDEAGNSWFRQVLENDYQHGLFIIDNCHLSPAASNAFCFQLKRKLLKKSAVLLISTPKPLESDWEEEAEDYFEYFERSNSVVKAEPESIWKDVLKTYSDVYRLAHPSRFVDVDVDFADETRNKQLENLCSHNLVGARALLDAWGKIGGQLSDIHQDKVLNILAQRHLTTRKAPALGPLCSLASFEISIHRPFLEQLDPDSVDQLRAENLLIVDDPVNYGSSYRVALHPKLASQIFTAYVRQALGSEYENHLEKQLAVYLKRYLLSGARNYSEVLVRTFVGGAVSLQHKLLDDVELQNFIRSQFNTLSLFQVMRYLSLLRNRHPDRAIIFLQDFYEECGHENFQRTLLKAPYSEFFSIVNQITRIDPNLGKKALGQLSAEQIILRIEQTDLGNVYEWISTSPKCVAAKCGYSIEWRKEVTNKLPLDTLVERAKTTKRKQEFMWFFDALMTSAPAQATLFVEKLTPDTLGQILANKSVAAFTSFLARIKKLYDVPDVLEKIETHLDPQAVVDSFRDEGDIKDFNRVWLATSVNFIQRVLDLMDDNLAVTILNRSSLDRIASFLEHRIVWFKPYYLSFANKHLRAKLEHADLKDIGRFITRVQRIDEGGHAVAVQAIEILLQMHLKALVAQSDLVTLSLLCNALANVDPAYRKRLLDKISAEEIKAAMNHSRVRGIQNSIRELAEAESTLLQTLVDELRDVDLTEKIEAADLNDRGYLLWNLRLAVGEELAKKYCQLIDSTLRPEEFARVSLSELAHLLWTLVHVSEAPDLRILEHETLHERLKNALPGDPGYCMYAIGVISLVRPDIVRNVFLPEIDLFKIGGPLAQWLKAAVQDKHPYMFSLTLQAVWVVDEAKAVTLIQHVFRKGSVRQGFVTVLTEALTTAITVPSIDILKTTITRIEQNASA